ncbi:MAG: 8-amino-7-oxononanoate synthase [Nitrospinae bacterium]|nr:8-amino-7-oxononanoate synthase [Nitrospinota bacterium]
MSSNNSHIYSKIQTLHKSFEHEQLFRSLKNISPTDSPHYIEINGAKLLNACSNNYLGLTHNPEIIQAVQKAVEEYGAGGGASRLVSGNCNLYSSIENTLIDFFELDNSFSSLVFSNGYAGNIGILSALGSFPNTEIFMDKLCHASLIDGALLSGAKIKRYKHNDSTHLEALFAKSHSLNKIIVTDGVFSMDGNLAHLNEIIDLKNKHKAFLVVDDAHGIGVLGEKGKGIIEELNISHKEIDCLIGTFGKAFGLYGAFAVAHNEVIDFFINKARSLIFSTALPPAILSGILTSLEIVKRMNAERSRLRRMSIELRNTLQTRGYKVPEGITPIVPIILGENEKALTMAEKCLQKGVFISAIRPPAVPKNRARLRLTLSSGFEEKEIDPILNCFE